MSRQEIEAALSRWRDATRRRDNATDGDRDALDLEVRRARDAFHQLSANYMMERIDALRDAEARRTAAVPSSDPFHQAARDEKAIAAEICDSARVSDEETPEATAEDEARAS